MKNQFQEFKEKEIKNLWSITGGKSGPIDRENSDEDPRECSR